MLKLKIKKELEKLDETLFFSSKIVEKEHEIEIKETENQIEIEIKEDLKSDNKGLSDKIESVFNRLEFNRQNLELINLENLINKWKEVKKDILFSDSDRNESSTIMHIAKYYENQKTLYNIIKNYSYVPFLMFFYKNINLNEDEEEIKLCNALRNDKIDFKIKLEKGEDENEYILSSRLDPQFDITEYENDLINIFSIPKDIPCSFKIELSGKYIYKEKLEYMKIELKLTSREILNYTKTIEIA